MKRPTLLTLFTLATLPAPAFARPYMSCGAELAPGQYSKILIDLRRERPSIDPGLNETDVQLIVRVLPSGGGEKTYDDSYGWIDPDGEFSFSFCRDVWCPLSLSGWITRSGQVRKVEINKPLDDIHTVVDKTKCELQ